MAAQTGNQPGNEFDSYDQVGGREDLADMVYNVSPADTPFYTMLKKESTGSTKFEWQTDKFRSSRRSKAREGADPVFDAITPTKRLENYSQIFIDPFVVSRTADERNTAGRARESMYLKAKTAVEQKLDIEKALLSNWPRDAGSAGNTAGNERETAGAITWLASNTVFETGGADPTG